MVYAPYRLAQLSVLVIEETETFRRRNRFQNSKTFNEGIFLTRFLSDRLACHCEDSNEES